MYIYNISTFNLVREQKTVQVWMRKILDRTGICCFLNAAETNSFMFSAFLTAVLEYLIQLDVVRDWTGAQMGRENITETTKRQKKLNKTSVSSLHMWRRRRRQSYRSWTSIQ